MITLRSLSSSVVSSLVTDADEYRHVPSESPDWRESYYFNFVDADSGISDFTTIGLLPNLAKREFVFALFYGDKREVHYLEPKGAVAEDPVESLSDGRLSYELVEPLKKWRIRFARIWPLTYAGAVTRVYGSDGSHHTLRSSLISPASFVRFSRPFQGGSTELFEEMAIHECDGLKEKGTGLIEWLFTHAKK